MKKSVFLTVLAIVCIFFSCQKAIEPYERRDIIKEHLMGDWFVEDVDIPMFVSNKITVPVKDKVIIPLIKESISNETKGTVLRIAEEKAYSHRKGNIYISNYSIEKDMLFFENPDLLGFPIPYIHIYQDSLKLDKMTAYLGKDKLIDILKNMGETSHLNLIESQVEDARCDLKFKRAGAGVYDDLFE